MRLVTYLLSAVIVLAASACSSDGGDDGSGSGSGGSGGSSGDGGGDNSPRPPDELVPEPVGTCPGFADGESCTSDATSLICTFSPAGLVPRPVRIWISDAARTTPGALVIFWHGLGGQAANAALARAGLGPDVVADILAKGGIVAAPERSEKRQTTSPTELPWLIALGAGEEDDLFVMDEIVGCAIQELNIDTRRIHTTGMSAGGLQTGQVAARRSGYLASVVPFSGGQLGSPPIQDPNNKYAAALFHGGDGDMVILNFKGLQTTFHDRLKSQGQFAILCDHGEGHRVTAAAATGGWAFMQDHPYGVTPEPYADGLPDTIPDYCVP